MNWNKIDLTSAYERAQPIIDSLNSDTLLLEIQCNLKKINRETVKEQFETDLKSRITSAREVFESNMDNLVEEARRYREDQ